MKRVSQQMRLVSECLVANESKGRKRRVKTAPSSFQTPDRLRPQMATLMGTAGFRAMLLRALVLAKADAPWLDKAHVSPNGPVEFTDESDLPASEEAIREGEIVLMAQLLGLMEVFIGEKLTLQIVHDVWPKLNLQGSNVKRKI